MMGSSPSSCRKVKSAHRGALLASMKVSSQRRFRVGLVRCRFWLALVSACILTGACRTTGSAPPPPPPGMAFFDGVPYKEHATRVGGSKIVAVNGDRLSRPAAGIDFKPGEHRVTMQFHWPQGGEEEAELEFPVVAGRRYTIRYWPHPPDYSKRFNSDFTDDDIPVSGSEADIFLVPAAFGLLTTIETAKYGAHRAQVAKDQRRHAEYVDIVVISSHAPEGVVCRERVFAPAAAAAAE